MAKLKIQDIMGDDTPPVANAAVSRSTPEPRPQPKPARRKPATDKPSPFEADLRAKLRDKVQMSFGYMPRFCVDIFEAQASAKGMNRREYLYHLLREQGGDIPPYERMDGRKL